MKLEVGKTYITKAGYLVKIVKRFNDFFYTDKKYSPGKNASGNTINHTTHDYGWAWSEDGTIELDKEWSDNLQIVREAPFEIPECPKGYKWAGGYPQIKTPQIDEYYLHNNLDGAGWCTVYKPRNFQTSREDYNLTDKDFFIPLEKVVEEAKTPDYQPTKKIQAIPFSGEGRYRLANGQIVNLDNNRVCLLSDNVVGKTGKSCSWAWYKNGTISGLGFEDHFNLFLVEKLVDSPVWRYLQPEETIKKGDHLTSRINQGGLSDEDFINSDCGGWIPAGDFDGKEVKQYPTVRFKRRVYDTPDEKIPPAKPESKPMWRKLNPDEGVRIGDYYSAKINQRDLTEEEFLNSNNKGWTKVSSVKYCDTQNTLLIYKRLIEEEVPEKEEAPEVISQEVTPQQVETPEGYRPLDPEEFPKKGDIAYHKGKNFYTAPINYVQPVKDYSDLLFFRPIQKEQTMKTLASRALTYFVTEPAVTLGKPIVKSLRYVLFVGMLTTLGYGAANPTAVTSFVKKYTPKVTIEMPK